MAIQVYGLGKRYAAGVRGPTRAHEAIERAVRRLFGQPRRKPGETFWAVKDCCFEVGQGEVVALMGRNGAGKSVLLKMLSGVVKPSAGEALIRGRMTALLELGSGFHPEMTGRENVFFNGVILGMRRVEMQRKLDRIVDFSGVGDFLDVPVKHYSSGMYLRLAFAIAAHVDTDVLLIDEMLAVGDAAFQEKCLDRIREVARQGATIFIVSHELTVLSGLCTRGLYLDRGRLLLDGSLDEAADRYRQDLGVVQQI
ncbi:MAG TPA: ABC transporter ATP-binding protein [Bryobacteraceae bacterium]